MGKLFLKFLGALIAIVATFAMGKTVWAQEIDPCVGANKFNLCVACYADACPPCQNDNCPPCDQQAACECGCKWATPEEMSKKECLSEVCGTDQGGVGSKIGTGSVFGGNVYATVVLAIEAALDKREELGLAENVTVVYKDFYPITNFSDSQMVHFKGIPGSYVGDPDLYEPPTTGGNVWMSYAACTAGINQDGSQFTAGCQPGRGCFERPPSAWLGTGCPAQSQAVILGCCNLTGGCPARTGGPDTTAGNGRYGTNSPGCQ